MDNKSTVKRKTGGLIAKNIIIFVVLIAVCALSIWAWFTIGQKADANGISIRSKADGVQVSWDGVNYYDNLTALQEADVVKGSRGLAKNISGKDGEPESLKLITGNGLNFFEPYLNRRTGDVLKDSNGAWQGVNITDDNSGGRYIDIDLYFRGTSQRDVYLAGDSLVSPKNINTRISDFGPFSKDYIAAASRVAFLDAKKENVSFIWAPNADIELVENNAGYTRVTTTAQEDVTISGGGTTDIDGGVEDDGKTYYFWTFNDDAVVTSSPNNLSSFEARQFEYSSEYRYFVTEVTTYIPTYDGTNPSIPIFINESGTSAAANNYNTYIDGASSKNLIRTDLGQYFGVTNTNYNIGDVTCSNAMYIISGNITAGSKITYKLGYDPVNKLLVVLEYKVTGGGSFSLGGQETDITTTVTYYPLENGTTCVLANPADSAAVSSGVNYKKAVQFIDSNKNNIHPVSVTKAEQFVAEQTGTGYSATYKFKNVNTNTYLNIGSGKVSLGASGSSFSLYYSSEHTGPLLKSGDYYLVVQNGVVKAVKAGELKMEDVVTVYTGSSYKLNTGLTSDSQTYEYYDASSHKLVSLGPATAPKLFTSTSTDAATTLIGGTKIATLTMDESTQSATTATESDTTSSTTSTEEIDTTKYYTAHIVMRIWVEGTDREAKTPLADGIFDMNLHFVSQ
ncbi:MAG: hypothetical protein IJC86_02165 [Clostridia bacterium]|nr:hypothetical protein [Clostridia bacterium]